MTMRLHTEHRDLLKPAKTVYSFQHTPLYHIASLARAYSMAGKKQKKEDKKKRTFSEWVTIPQPSRFKV